jgi:nucleotide-binding universal stress UspA family protein
MKTILVPLDGSSQANAVLPYVAYLARSLAAHVCLLRVLPEVNEGVPQFHDVAASYGVGDGMVVQDEAAPTLDRRRHQAEEELFDVLLDLQTQSIAAEIDVQVGHPAEVIVEQATAKGMCMIAMATHGWSGLRRWALGSVTDKVIQVTRTPVFVVRNDVEPQQAQPAIQFRNVLVPVDQSTLSRKALPTAAELAAAVGANIVLLHALTPLPLPSAPDLYMTAEVAELYVEPDESTRARALADLHIIAEQLYERYGVSVRCEVPVGLAAEAIVETVERRTIDLVVMATHGYSGIRRWALGSVADKVLHTCPEPLLLVRAG